MKIVGWTISSLNEIGRAVAEAYPDRPRVGELGLPGFSCRSCPDYTRCERYEFNDNSWEYTRTVMEEHRCSCGCRYEITYMIDKSFSMEAIIEGREQAYGQATRTMTRIFELGSSRSYLVPTVGAARAKPNINGDMFGAQWWKKGQIGIRPLETEAVEDTMIATNEVVDEPKYAPWTDDEFMDIEDDYDPRTMEEIGEETERVLNKVLADSRAPSKREPPDKSKRERLRARLTSLGRRKLCK